MYGIVLVLDGVIQCTERDEFSYVSQENLRSRTDRAHVCGSGSERYQEMIAHLPLASHPNPKKVLVIGGGDGSVVREVLKHDTVEEVILCDIDEAVMHVDGDGFTFLMDNTSIYDVIITDSSDPVGPAASLVQKPYFELLRNALTPGGHIFIQGKCLGGGDRGARPCHLACSVHPPPERHQGGDQGQDQRRHDELHQLISPAIRELEGEIKKARIVVMNEIGLDPGVDHLHAIKTIGEGRKVEKLHSFRGGLPAPECSDIPLSYKFSWPPRGGLLALLNSAAYLAEGKQVDIQGKDLECRASLLHHARVRFYNIPEAETVIRGTLRYQGFPEFVKALVALGWLNREKKEWLKDGLTWAQIMQQAIGASDASERSGQVADAHTPAAPSSRASRSSASSPARRKVSVSSPASKGSAATVRNGNLLETLMKYEPGSRDLVMLQYKLIVEWGDSTTDTIVDGHPAMALYVFAISWCTSCWTAEHARHPCAVLEGDLRPLREISAVQGMSLVEKVL
ncbi:glyceraldehyde-3-phosphate dehydrogenase-like protein [Cubamyces sp. BRFM 1775]|nr:glyceraldehyde-3-phosphate dehydrogenase-like protein [Cubamyces sp. BRFM 1775]